ncbi:GDPmannose 4,6-dehydratase [Methanolobus profundi]|uniref:GDP-mannose 4,6-dehydratase n=2 Tax=Methanolobus profundi TaxID=487685 RepID=A0A1I4UJS0_9EURY|nr:GDPmannose 4,6-dehydratase [Methanolobus profundi]
MKAIIFGAKGQDGHYLSKLLVNKKVDVIGISRTHGDFKGDVADYSFVEQVITSHQPDYIFHFAANSTTAHSALFENHNSISTGTLNILECVRLHCPTAKVFLSGSAMQFKNEGLPIDEQTPFEANSPYSVSRIQSVYAGRYYRSAFNLKVYVGYFFNHDSPLRSERHVNQKVVNSVKRIAKGSTEKLMLGNIDVKKEFNYAGDVIEAVWTLINQDTIFEATIGCGRTHSIREWVEYCFKRINKKWEDHVIIDNDFVPDYKILVSNPELIKSIGWKQNVGFHELADMMMETQ